MDLNLITMNKAHFIYYGLACLFLLGFLVSCEDERTDPMDPRFISKGDEIQVRLNERFQTIHHFGASDAWSAEWVGRWPDVSKEPMAKLLFSDEMDAEGNPEGIALTMWRFNIGEGAADQVNSGYASNHWKRETESFLNADGSYDWTRQEGSRWFLQKARDYGVPYVTLWTNSPPYFMTKNGFTFRTEGVEGYNLEPSNYEDFATHLATVTKHLEDEGYPVIILTPFNEPQYEWQFEVGSAVQSGSYATNKEIADITRLIDQKFEALGVKSKIMLPEAGTLRELYEQDNDPEASDQLQEFYGGGSNSVGSLSSMSKYVAGHSYWLNPSVDVSINHRKELLSKMNAVDPTLEFWQTEYSLLGADYRQGGDWTQFTPMDYALWLARIIHIDLVHANATGWSYWTAMNNSEFQDHSDRFSLLLWKPNTDGPSQTDGTFEIQKNLWTLGNFSRFVRPGMTRINVSDPEFPSAEDAGKSFMISGYQGEGQLVMVMINYTDAQRRIAIGNYGDDFEFEGDEITLYTTSATKNLEAEIVSIEDIVVGPRSITTLVGKLK